MDYKVNITSPFNSTVTWRQPHAYYSNKIPNAIPQMETGESDVYTALPYYVK